MNYKIAIKSEYEKEADRYLYKRAWMQTYVWRRVLDTIAHMVSKTRPKLILNIGCGPGAIEMGIKEIVENASLWVAADVSQNMARLAARNSGVQGLVCDAEHLPFRDGVFDLIISSRMIKFVNLSNSFKEFRRVIREGCRLAVLFDSGDPVWVRLLERCGKFVDVGIWQRTLRSRDLELAGEQVGLRLERKLAITYLPLSLLGKVPRALVSLVSLIDRPRRGRLTLIIFRRIS